MTFMFCPQCGKPLPGTARFCPHCGAPVTPLPQEPVSPPVPEPETPPSEPDGFVIDPKVFDASTEAPKGPEEAPREPETPPEEPRNEPQIPPPQPPESSSKPVKEGSGKKPAPTILIAALLVVAALAALGFAGKAFLDKKAQEALAAAVTQADAALASGDYAAAGAAYRDILSENAGHPAATLGLAESMAHQGDYAGAAALLAQLSPAPGDPLYDRFRSLNTVTRFDTRSVSVDTSSFPVVTVSVPCGESNVTQADVRVTEGGVDRPVTWFQNSGTSLSFSYQTDDAGYDSEQRSFTADLSVEGFPFTLSGTYDTPHFEPASLRLISTDVSDYPTVRAYFRVEGASGQTIPGLDNRAFLIQERLQGGEYLSREVHAVSPLDRQGLNIDLLADKSGSIYYDDMSKIRQVMTEFVHNLNYTAGDKAEVLAFDSIVQQMCCYTDDVSLLVNGINSMTPDGLTALYRALHDGVTNAALQGGARCVIAFTDGYDTEGGYSPDAIIQYALSSQVPIYIIGVNGCDEYTLRYIAESTGGRFWYIDDLYDLSGIFTQIYSEQKELYMVEYISDGAADPYALRDLSVTVTGGGYKGTVQATFQAAHTAQRTNHTSRYEVIKETLSWEEARQRCQQMGGHLATVTSQAEQDQIVALAQAQGVRYMWLGGYTSYDFDGSVFGHWITGEPFSFQNWDPNEPSRQDKDGTPEWYIMLWDVKGGWSWNDQRNDPAAVAKSLSKYMGFVCEYED